MRADIGSHDSMHRGSGLRPRLPAAGKLIVTIALLAVVALARESPLPALAVGGIAVLAAVLGRVPAGILLKRLVRFAPLVLCMAALSWLGPHGGRGFLLLVLRTSVCFLLVLLLSSTTSISELLRVLRRARVPPLLVTTLALTYRYLFVLQDEGARLRRARASRTLVRRRARAWPALAALVGQLFVRASERAERIYAAMCARGWR